MNSRGERWQKIRSIEDALALLCAADDLRRVIRLQAWHEGDWGAVYQAATEQAEVLRQLQALFANKWCDLMEMTDDPQMR